MARGQETEHEKSRIAWSSRGPGVWHPAKLALIRSRVNQAKGDGASNYSFNKS